MWLHSNILLFFAGTITAQTGCKTISKFTNPNPKNEKFLNRKFSLDKPCQFPFKVNGKTYYRCTHDPLPGNYEKFRPFLAPWCATKTDAENNVIIESGKQANFGLCDSDTCELPSRFCGEIVNSRIDIKDHRRFQVTQMPWLVSLGGFKSTNYWKHICGGSIITKKHVLTLASCIEKLVNSKETFIQGPKLFFGTDDTFDHFTGVNRNIAATFQHPKYKDKAGFDVGVVAVDEDIIFTDNIRPVCLPNFPHETSFEGENLFLQQFTYSQEWESFMLRNDDVTENGCQENVEGLSCLRKGDFEVNEGSPVVKKVTQTARREGYHVQEFISKNQMEMVKISERFILSWIQNITDTAPVLMVYGGKAKDGTPNYSTEVDIVTGNPNICYKVNKARAERWTWTMENGTEQSSWAFEAKQYNVAKNEIKDSGKYFIQAIGMAGHFVNDAVILCGGYYGAFESEICFQYDFEFNKWKQITSMNYPRHFATAELDNDGNMWMIGGRKILSDSDVSDAAPDSEVYKIDGKEWIPDVPLPKELKDGGVTDHCTVRLNSTHVMLISGKIQGFFFEDANAEQTGFGTKETADGGIVTNKAWMLGRESWKEVADLSIPRLQAACSILPDERDGSVKVLVVGGCKGSCNFVPPVSSTEIYDPDTNKWTKAADLPIPIFGGSLQLLNNVPTLIGGTSRYTGGYDQTDVLYQYHVDKNEWIPLDFKLKKPVAFSAVIPVPKNYLQTC